MSDPMWREVASCGRENQYAGSQNLVPNSLIIPVQLCWRRPSFLPFPMRSCVCAWSLENNAPNKGEVAAAAAFSSGVRPSVRPSTSEAAGATKEVSRVVARGLTSDSLLPSSTPGLFCCTLRFLPVLHFVRCFFLLPLLSLFPPRISHTHISVDGDS